MDGGHTYRAGLGYTYESWSYKLVYCLESS